MQYRGPTSLFHFTGTSKKTLNVCSGRKKPEMKVTRTKPIFFSKQEKALSYKKSLFLCILCNGSKKTQQNCGQLHSNLSLVMIDFTHGRTGSHVMLSSSGRVQWISNQSRASSTTSGIAVQTTVPRRVQSLLPFSECLAQEVVVSKSRHFRCRSHYNEKHRISDS